MSLLLSTKLSYTCVTFFLVSLKGLEPLTLCTGNTCSIHLSYKPKTRYIASRSDCERRCTCFAYRFAKHSECFAFLAYRSASQSECFASR